MTIAVDLGCKATKQTKQAIFRVLVEFYHDKTFSAVVLTMKYSTTSDYKIALLSFLSVYTGCIMGGCREV